MCEHSKDPVKIPLSEQLCPGSVVAKNSPEEAATAAATPDQNGRAEHCSVLQANGAQPSGSMGLNE